VELRHLRYFVAAAEEGHFGRAAQRLRISTPALSLQIRDLEHESGVELFERLPRGVRLTKAGAAFLTEARAVLSTLENGIARAQSIAHGKSGLLRVGHVPPVLRHAEVVSRLIPAFLASHRDVDVQAVQSTMDEQLSALREGRLDVAIAYAPPGRDFGLRTEVLYENLAHGAVMPAAYPVPADAPFRCSDLSGLPWLTAAHDTNAPLIDMLVHELQKRGLDTRPDENLYVTDPAVLIDLVAAGAGWMFSGPNVVDSVNAAHVVYREWAEAPIRVPCAVFWRDDDTSSLVADFLALARELRDAALAPDAYLSRPSTQRIAPVTKRR
jgi:LysR family transcriptional regulator, benzoate and cis,cis-muconate-responsive activator of ben and cat genes